MRFVLALVALALVACESPTLPPLEKPLILDAVQVGALPLGEAWIGTSPCGSPRRLASLTLYLDPARGPAWSDFAGSLVEAYRCDGVDSRATWALAGTWREQGGQLEIRHHSILGSRRLAPTAIELEMSHLGEAFIVLLHMRR